MTTFETSPVTGPTHSMKRTYRVRGGLAAAAAAGLFTLAACTSDLQVTDPVNLTPGDLGANAPISITINGARGAFQASFDRYVLYTDLLSDAMVAAGTFPYQAEIDDRIVRTNNEGLLGDVYIPLSTARFMADTALAVLEGAAGAPNVNESERLNGVALARYYGGYTRAMLAEAFCASAVVLVPATSHFTVSTPDATPLLACEVTRNGPALGFTVSATSFDESPPA